MSLTQVTPDVLHSTQGNITTVGTLGSLTVSGNVSAGNVTATNFIGTASLANNASFLGGTPAASYALGSAVTTANTAMKGYVDAVTTAWTANAGAQAGSIATLTSNAAVQAGLIASKANTTTVNALVTAKGYISFESTTAAVYASSNLSVTRNSPGNFTITLAAGIQNGTVNYAPMVSAINKGQIVAMGFGPDALDVYGVGVTSISAGSFTVVATRNFDGGIGFYGGGNDGNNVHNFETAALETTAVTTRITIVVF